MGSLYSSIIGAIGPCVALENEREGAAERSEKLYPSNHPLRPVYHQAKINARVRLQKLEELRLAAQHLMALTGDHVDVSQAPHLTRILDLLHKYSHDDRNIHVIEQLMVGEVARASRRR